jgi:4'-phosphopantetheinyl transferase
MSWQPVSLTRLIDAQALEPDGLHVWWWPEAAPSPASARRSRVDRLLRTLLAPYLGMPAGALRFGRESKGRPFLIHEGAPDFNLSDTRGGSVLAVAAKGRVGIDVERCDREPPVLALASRWFAPDEAQALRTLAERDADAARRAFLRLWTAKEASCKATGTGIYARLAAWRFAIAEDDAAPTALGFPEEAGEEPRWRFWRLSPAPTHTVVLACCDQFTAPRCFRVVDNDA